MDGDHARVTITIDFKTIEWAKIVKSAQRRSIEPAQWIREAATDEPLSIKMVAASWMLKHLYELAKVAPQVGAARTKVEEMIEALK